MITNDLVPTLCVGMHSKRSASLDTFGRMRLKSGKHGRHRVKLSFIFINRRGASGLHSHAKRGNESLLQIRYNQHFLKNGTSKK